MTEEFDRSNFKRTNNLSCIGMFQSDYCTRCVFCVRCYKCTDCEDCEECIDCHFCIQCFGLRRAAFRYRNKSITPDEFFVLSNHVVDNHVLRRIQKKYKDKGVETRSVVFAEVCVNTRTKQKVINYYRNNLDKILYLKMDKGYIKLSPYEGQNGQEIGLRDFIMRPNDVLVHGLPYVLCMFNNTHKEILSFVTFASNIDN